MRKLITLILLIFSISLFAQNKSITTSINPITTDVQFKIGITSPTPICKGGKATFQAYNATAEPIKTGYQWVINGVKIAGATEYIYTYPPQNGDIVYCIIPQNGLTSNNIKVQVLDRLPVSVSISSIVNSAVQGVPVTVTATPINGGNAPTYQWFVNGTNMNVNSSSLTFTPVTNSNVNCIVTSNQACVTGNPAASNMLTITLVPSYSCPNTPTISYEGKVYTTVQIGTQCWMRENLNVGTRINGSQNQTNNNIVEKYCYNDLESNCSTYGGLYNWSEIVQYQNGATNTTNWNPIPTGNVRGICPPGWHLPRQADFVTLWTFLGGQYVAGGKLKEAGLAHWLSPNVGATNITNFNGFPAGFRWTTGAFMYGTKDVSYWTVTGGYDNGVTSMRYGGC